MNISVHSCHFGNMPSQCESALDTICCRHQADRVWADLRARVVSPSEAGGSVIRPYHFAAKRPSHETFRHDGRARSPSAPDAKLSQIAHCAAHGDLVQCTPAVQIEEKTMPMVMPIKEFGNVEKVRSVCMNATDPIFISDDGREDMVLLNIGLYNKLFARMEIYGKLAEGERDVSHGRVSDAFAMLDRLGTSSDV